ncbi:hypothetical protein JHK82_035511 [Glycine max]|uniref:Uncharacterized protein n=1 Tax=Glycine max TaxID=3847 RepID=K7LXD2_SOYBN|nr:hypothetical protein JHK87_035436 [Glycine soja]KAG4969810.1 hypothetical protein JHK85_036231 [Glycine max]KAG4976167.1 hypothetical protein JHK86_035641 [Glycine max]KAG5112242.1 hypothetical protein JHK82_035511 [Glycine max]KAG5129523.1 hypothetical protein JHK84_035920 [Glycine max]
MLINQEDSCHLREVLWFLAQVQRFKLVKFVVFNRKLCWKLINPEVSPWNAQALWKCSSSEICFNLF